MKCIRKWLPDSLKRNQMLIEKENYNIKTIIYIETKALELIEEIDQK